MKQKISGLRFFEAENPIGAKELCVSFQVHCPTPDCEEPVLVGSTGLSRIVVARQGWDKRLVPVKSIAEELHRGCNVSLNPDPSRFACSECGVVFQITPGTFAKIREEALGFCGRHVGASFIG